MGQALQKNEGIAERVAALIEEITLASREQDDGTGQINNHVAHIDQMTQANAACSEESAASAEELNAQAESMRGMVLELRTVLLGRATAGANACIEQERLRTNDGSEIVFQSDHDSFEAAESGDIRPIQSIIRS
ncbi:MAG: hypothetical protein ACLFU2_07125 [Opitutales bacterium]